MISLPKSLIFPRDREFQRNFPPQREALGKEAVAKDGASRQRKALAKGYKY